jgi:hypothetical protein
MGLWDNTLCGCGIATSLDNALCETFTALYYPLGGIGSGAMTVADKERMIETPLMTDLPLVLPGRNIT